MRINSQLCNMQLILVSPEIHNKEQNWYNLYPTSITHRNNTPLTTLLRLLMLGWNVVWHPTRGFWKGRAHSVEPPPRECRVVCGSSYGWLIRSGPCNVLLAKSQGGLIRQTARRKLTVDASGMIFLPLSASEHVSDYVLFPVQANIQKRKHRRRLPGLSLLLGTCTRL